jgi:hypothetical protein
MEVCDHETFRGLPLNKEILVCSGNDFGGPRSKVLLGEGSGQQGQLHGIASRALERDAPSAGLVTP